MSYKTKNRPQILIESGSMYLDEYTGSHYTFTPDPEKAWTFTPETALIRLKLVQKSHPKAKMTFRSEAIERAKKA